MSKDVEIPSLYHRDVKERREGGPTINVEAYGDLRERRRSAPSRFDQVPEASGVSGQTNNAAGARNDKLCRIPQNLDTDRGLVDEACR